MLGLLYDVHGNLPALEAVLADARAPAPARWLLGGDYALFGAWPAETRRPPAASSTPRAWIRGNGERWTADPDARPTTRSCPARSPPPRGARRRPRRRPGRAPRASALPAAPLFCHASPRPTCDSFLPEPGRRRGRAARRRRPPRARLRPHPPAVPARSARAASSWSTRARSACRSTATPAPPTRSSHDDGRVEHRRVAYDHAASAAAVRERFGDAPWTETVAAASSARPSPSDAARRRRRLPAPRPAAARDLRVPDSDVLVDAGTRQARRRILRQLTDARVRVHALTHAHPDHQGVSHAICDRLGIPSGGEDVPAMESPGVMPSAAAPGWRCGAALLDGSRRTRSPGGSRGREVAGFTVLESPATPAARSPTGARPIARWWRCGLKLEDAERSTAQKNWQWEEL